VLETLRCPSCSTRFGLRASRVHPGIRRAQCFRCDTVFGIEEAVAHLLAPAETGVEPEPLPEPPPSLTLGDLEGAEEEILDKTMIDVPAPPSPEAEESPYVANGPGYSSAKDAITKLMGTAVAPKALPRAQSTHPGGMDVEATLHALEDTLGGQRSLGHGAVTQPVPVPAAISVPPPLPTPPPLPEPTAAPEPPPLPEPAAPAPRAFGTNMASTMRLSSSEIQAALAAALPEGLPPVVATVPEPSIRIEPPYRPEPFATQHGGVAAQDPNLLKVQLEQEIYNNVSLDQMNQWIEEGRVHEYNMVARQFSEHWIEASKVPALRPIFEQRKRNQGILPEDMPMPPAEILPQKKGLFGGLFGRS
jgi:hypothetical protein